MKRHCWICATCGTQFAQTDTPPPACPICEDERQYVGWSGQRWTTHEELARAHRIQFDVEDGVTTLDLAPAFAINQRAFLIPHERSNILWECLSLVTEAALAEIRSRGGVSCIAISHPHFYASMVQWSDALGGVPIYLHEADRAWVQRPSAHIRFWQGEQLPLSEDIALLRLGGHFPGSTGLWWKSGPTAGGSLFPGDAIQVAMDRRRAAFMYSYPNLIPLHSSALRALRDAVAPFQFADVFGYARGRQIIGGAKQAVHASLQRYLESAAS